MAMAAASIAFGADGVMIMPGKMARIGTVDERFQSYNVEMVEVTGGRFWAPYGRSGQAPQPKPAPALATPGLDPSLFRERPPTDLGSSRLRKLAAALSPAYVRVSGTWANSVYFHDAESAPPSTPPPGFGGILTRAQWKGVVEFTKVVKAKLVTSFTISPGARDASGAWQPGQASDLLRYTRDVGGSIAAAEFFNEPSIAEMGGAPKGYDAKAYGRDFKVFLNWARRSDAEMLVLGPGSVGETGEIANSSAIGGRIRSEDMLAASGRGLDAFSYHFYGAVSKRCAALGAAQQTTPDAALTEQWLAITDRDLAFYAALRDKFEPQKPVWLTETAETACGGNPWASTYLDTFRYVDQLGRLARKGVQVVMHNTLAASDYGLIDEETLLPRPSYWAAVLWRRLMGTTVLVAGPSPVPEVHLYAHCLRGRSGGVAVLAINTDRKSAHSLTSPIALERYTMTAKDLLSTSVELNGEELKLEGGESLPKMQGLPENPGAIQFPPASVTYLAFPKAVNASCK
jgi:heparanase